MPRLRRTASVLLAASLLGPFGAGAAETGLTVTPPPGYAARPLPPARNQAARFEVKRPDDADTGCQVSFTEAPANGRFTQAELDRVMRGREWQDTARSALSAIYEIRDASIREGKARPAFVMAADLLDRPGLPPRAREIRTLFVIQETPRGRAATVCVAGLAEFEARRAEFLSLADALTVP